MPANAVHVFILPANRTWKGRAWWIWITRAITTAARNLLQSMVATPERYAHLKDAEGNWVVRDDVHVRFRNRQGVMAGGLTIGYTGYGSMDSRHHIGPELQIGHRLGDALEAPVLLVKTAWGGKSLFKNFRPPSAGGETGEFYTKMLAEVNEALDAVPEEFPQLAGRPLVVRGFVWFQGWNDMYDEDARAQYEDNLVHLIGDVRAEYNTPRLPVIIGELGNGGPEATTRCSPFAPRNRRQRRGRS